MVTLYLNGTAPKVNVPPLPGPGGRAIVPAAAGGRAEGAEKRVSHGQGSANSSPSAPPILP